MSKKKILSVHHRVPGNEVEFVSITSDRSLLDADIVLFEPALASNYSETEHQGKRLLTEASSATAVAALAHWRAELQAVQAAGKLVVVFLVKPIDVLVHTGQQAVSGVGRNRAVTNYVTQASSYSVIPEIKVTPKSGTEFVHNGKAGFFAPFWTEFREQFPEYEVWIEGKFSDVLLHTKSGNRTLGAALRHGAGATLFLPPIQYPLGSSRRARGGVDSKKPTPTQFGNKVIAALVALAASLGKERAASPPPTWTSAVAYSIPGEVAVRSQILGVQEQLVQRGGKE